MTELGVWQNIPNPPSMAKYIFHSFFKTFFFFFFLLIVKPWAFCGKFNPSVSDSFTLNLSKCYFVKTFWRAKHLSDHFHKPLKPTYFEAGSCYFAKKTWVLGLRAPLQDILPTSWGSPPGQKRLSILGTRLHDFPHFRDFIGRMDPIFSVLAMEVIVPMRLISFLAPSTCLKHQRK